MNNINNLLNDNSELKEFILENMINPEIKNFLNNVNNLSYVLNDKKIKKIKN